MYLSKISETNLFFLDNKANNRDNGLNHHFNVSYIVNKAIVKTHTKCISARYQKQIFFFLTIKQITETMALTTILMLAI